MQERVAVDWKKLEKTIEVLKEKYLDEEEDKWYRELKGTLSYAKLKALRSFCDKRTKVY